MMLVHVIINKKIKGKRNNFKILDLEFSTNFIHERKRK